MNKKDKLVARLKDKQYRDSFVSSHIKIGVPFQIRALREHRGWTQKELAVRVGTKQAWIAQIENPNYSGFSLKTLLKLASVFDVGLIVRYVPFSSLVKWELELAPESLKVQSFEEDPYFKPQPINIPCQAGLSLGVSMSLESIAKATSPSLVKPEPIDIVKYFEVKQRKMESVSPKLMQGGSQ
jgi:transcriptional regulator with XRE-family HTH domain